MSAMEAASSEGEPEPDPEADAAALADSLKTEGNQLLTDGKFGLAADKYTEALTLNPESAILYSNRAMAYMKMESYGLAIADAEEAIHLDRTYVKSYYRRGSANFALGKYKIARNDFRTVCKLKPSDKDARAKLKECEKQVKEAMFAAAIIADDPEPYSASLHPDTISVEDAYDGPRLGDDGVLTAEFVESAMERFKEQKLIHRKYVIQILLGVKDVLEAEPTLIDIELPDAPAGEGGAGGSSGADSPGSTATAAGGDDEADSDDEVDEAAAAAKAAGGAPKKGHVTVCGDVHGQFYDLMNIFAINGLPSVANPYLFNGDFVDRGSFSVEVVLTLLMFKLLAPKSIFMTRGNHESRNMTKIYGFEGEVRHKFDAQLINLFYEVFCWLPLAACIDKGIFVVHGGLASDDGVTLDDVRAVDRNHEPPDAGLMCDLLWADPQANPGRSPSKRGVGLAFGPDVTRDFLSRNKLKMIVRSHEVRDNGYELEHGGQLCTVFSAPNYCDQMGNKGAFIHFGPGLDPKFTTFEHVPHPNVRPMAYASGLMGL